MTEKTRMKILVAIAYLSMHNLTVNKQKVSNYTGLSWITVSRYFDEMYDLFLLDDINQFKKKYKKEIKC